MWEVHSIMKITSVTVTLAEPLSRYRKLDRFAVSKSDSELLPDVWPR